MKRIILVIVIALGMIGIIWWYQARVPVGGPTVSVTNTQSETVEAQIEAVDIGDLDGEFQEIDAGIATL